MPPPTLPSAVAGAIARLRSLYRGLTNRDEVESEMREEFRHHVEMRTDDLVRQGLPRTAAARQARIEFGRADTHREDARASRGLHFFDQIRFSWIDVKLALRMLVKNPVLTVVALFALAVGIPVGLAPAHLAKAMEAPLPEDPANRIRAIRYWDPLTTSVSSTGYEEFRFWSDRLASFSAVAAFRTSSYNVAVDGGPAAPAAGAQLSASAFDILRTPPELGRTLVAADGQAGAPTVALIGHDLWKSRFGSDPAMLGRIIHVGQVPHTVVGIMPPGFRFPANEQVWLPLREPTVTALGQSAQVRIFGRLAEGVPAEQAQAELSATGRPPLADPAEARLRLRAEVVPFGLLFIGVPRGGLDSLPEFKLVQLLTLVLLLVACGNVAMLVFARTATRFRELAVRTALGASRVRIISQIFVEALVLAVAAAAVGVLSIDWILGHVNLAALAGQPSLPYWLSVDVTGNVLIWAIVLAAVSATVAGVIPAVRITGRGIHQRIRTAEAGRSGLRFGGLTSALVVADIAIAVAAVGLGLGIADQAMNERDADKRAGIAAAEYLAVQFTMLDDGLAAADGADGRRFTDRLAAAQRSLVAQLQVEPGVEGVAVAEALPRMEHRSRPIEVEGLETSPDGRGKWVRTARIDVGFFDALGQRAVAGRVFDHSDLEGGRATAIVNTPFVERVLGGLDPIGRRIRFQSAGDEDAEWREIVGVVEHLGVNMVSSEHGDAVYLPARFGQINPIQLGIHAGATPAAMIPRVRELAMQVDPDLTMGSAVVLSEVHQGDWYLTVALAAGLALLVGILLALAISGIYAMLSFAVSERTREIGIRSALGAQRGTLVVAILRRSLVQIGIGTVIGLPVAARVVFELSGNAGQGRSPAVAVLGALGLAAGIVLVVGVCACLAPTRRVLAIEASEALRTEG